MVSHSAPVELMSTSGVSKSNKHPVMTSTRTATPSPAPLEKQEIGSWLCAEGKTTEKQFCLSSLTPSQVLIETT